MVLQIMEEIRLTYRNQWPCPQRGSIYSKVDIEIFLLSYVYYWQKFQLYFKSKSSFENILLYFMMTLASKGTNDLDLVNDFP